MILAFCLGLADITKVEYNFHEPRIFVLYLISIARVESILLENTATHAVIVEAAYLQFKISSKKQKI